MHSLIAEKFRARELRSQGIAVPTIAETLGVAKSSVSSWVRDLPVPEKFTKEYRAKKKQERLAALTEERDERKAQKNIDRIERQKAQGASAGLSHEKIISGSGRWMIPVPIGYKGKTYIEGRYVYEHRYLMEKQLGRLLRFNEVVHHKNGDRMDNRLENLEVISRDRHSSDHNKERGYLVAQLRCPSCGSVFERPLRRLNRKGSSHVSFCSRHCIGRFFRRGIKISEEEKKSVFEKSVIQTMRKCRVSRTGKGPDC